MDLKISLFAMIVIFGLFAGFIEFNSPDLTFSQSVQAQESMYDECLSVAGKGLCNYLYDKESGRKSAHASSDGTDSSSLTDNNSIVGQGSNSTKLTIPKKSKDLTSEDRVLVKLTPSGTTAHGNVSPKNIKIKAGTTVVWQNDLPEKVYVESKPDGKHSQGELLNGTYIFPGESREQQLNDIGSFIYDGNSGFGSYYVRGYITVVNETTPEENMPGATIQNQANNYDVSQIKWSNFTNDLKQFSVEYPDQWQTKIGNRFTGGPPLVAENLNSNPSQIKSKIEIKVFDNDGKSPLKWAQSDKKNIVDSEKNSKLIEPVSCEVYKIDNAQACSFVYATKDKQGRTSANLHVFVNDNASQTHSIKYGTDASVYDLETPVMQHLLNSYKLIKNHNTDAE